MLPSNTATTIGIRIPNVPHEVPVANARKHATKKITAGNNEIKSPATDFIDIATNSFAPRESVIDFKVHAIVRIKMAGTIALKPSTKQSMQFLNGRTLLITYKRIVITKPKKLPIARPTEASLFENAVIKSFPLKNPPV